MKSHINEAKFTKRIPTDTYAFEEYSLSAAIDASESGEDVLVEMRRQVSAAFAADLIESTERKEEHKTAKKAAKTEKKEEKKNAKPGKSKVRPSDDEDEDGEDSELEDQRDDGEGSEDDEAADGEDGDNDHDSADDSEGDEESEDGDYADGDQEESEDEEERKPAKGKSSSKPAAQKSEGKKSFKKKPQTYNRGIDQHREIFSRVLRSVNPDWKNSDVLKVRAKKISEALEGEDFLDENGEVIAEFKAEVKKRMTAKAK